jgi:hypothetical protein
MALQWALGREITERRAIGAFSEARGQVRQTNVCPPGDNDAGA